MSRRGLLQRARAAAVLLAVIIGCGMPALFSQGEPPKRAKLKSNDACYVCHMPFLKEDLATAHAKAKVWCGTCHGASLRHIENENIGATPPDVVYKKCQIDRMCGKCHKPKKHPKLTSKARAAHLAKGKKAQQDIKGRTTEVTGVCTDCHGRHWIPPRDRPAEPTRVPRAN